MHRRLHCGQSELLLQGPLGLLSKRLTTKLRPAFCSYLHTFANLHRRPVGL